MRYVRAEFRGFVGGGGGGHEAQRPHDDERLKDAMHNDVLQQEQAGVALQRVASEPLSLELHDQLNIFHANVTSNFEFHRRLTWGQDDICRALNAISMLAMAISRIATLRGWRGWGRWQRWLQIVTEYL